MRTFAIAALAAIWAFALARGEPQLQIGSEETAAFIGGRTCVAIDSKGQPHIVVDDGQCCAGENWFVAHRIDGKWKRTHIPASKVGNPGRLYVPHLVVDSDDRAWVSGFIAGPGSGLILLESVSTTPAWKWYVTFKAGDGSGNAEVDATRPGLCIYYSRDNFKVYNTGKDVENEGELKVGGDKGQTFRIHPSGVWHASSNHSGYYNNTELLKENSGSKKWIDLNTYGGAGAELNYSGLSIDLENPDAAYFAVQSQEGIVGNIWNGEKMVFDPKSLLSIAPSGVGYGNGIIRWGPRLCPAAGGGAFVVWTAEGQKVMIRYIGADGTAGTPQFVGDGQNASAMVDNNGDLHVAYGRGGCRYRKILVDKPNAALDNAGRKMLRQAAVNKKRSQAFVDIRGRYTTRGAVSGTGVMIDLPDAVLCIIGTKRAP